jgi:chorismate dehydratase
LSKPERLGIVSYTNVAPLHWGLRPWGPEVGFVHGVPSELNAALLAGGIDLTLISSVEFIRHRDQLSALPDFSIATRGAVRSVMLFHRAPWSELHGARVALTSDSATSIALLQELLKGDGIPATFAVRPPDLPAMLEEFDAALLIGDIALREAALGRSVHGVVPLVSDLGELWFERTGLPFTFAVWAARRGSPPSDALVAELREARRRGLADLDAVAAAAAARVGLSPAVMRSYLSNFRYFFEAPEREGLAHFARLIDPSFEPTQLHFLEV